MKLLTVFLFMTLSMLSFAQVKHALRIDPDNARGGTTGEIIDSIKFIPLETKKESVFGVIDQMEVTDSLFIILDFQSKAILFFYRDGRFKNRIAISGIDKYINYFGIDEKNRKLYISNNFEKGPLVYDFEGNFLYVENAPKELERIATLFYLNGKIIYKPNRLDYSKDSKKSYYDLVYTQDGKIIRSFKPYNPRIQDEQFNTMDNFFTRGNQEGSFMYALPFTNKAYELNDTGISDVYEFIFSQKYSLPKGFDSSEAFKDKRIQYAYLDPENIHKIHNISSVYRLGDYLLFSAMNTEMLNTSDLNYLYNLKNGTLISFTKVAGDSSTSFFPVLSNVFEKARAVRNNKVYAPISSHRFKPNFLPKGDKLNFPPELKNIIAEENKHHNPVLIEFTLKPGL